MVLLLWAAAAAYIPSFSVVGTVVAARFGATGRGSHGTATLLGVGGFTAVIGGFFAACFMMGTLVVVVFVRVMSG